jgi:hypothetical protein
MRYSTKAAICTGLLAAGVGALAQQPLPADPTSEYNQMMTKCLEQSDPAMNKEDAIRACKEKWKQGLKVGKPQKPKPKPNDDTPGKT